MARDDGGLAFGGMRYEMVDPSDPTYPNYCHVTHPGMSLRDWFAGQALAGQLAFSPHDSFDKYHQPEEVAALAYRMADAMIAARSK